MLVSLWIRDATITCQTTPPPPSSLLTVTAQHCTESLTILSPSSQKTSGDKTRPCHELVPRSTYRFGMGSCLLVLSRATVQPTRIATQFLSDDMHICCRSALQKPVGVEAPSTTPLRASFNLRGLSSTRQTLGGSQFCEKEFQGELGCFFRRMDSPSARPAPGILCGRFFLAPFF